MLVLRRSHVELFLARVNLVVLDDRLDNLADVVLLVEAIKNIGDPVQLCVGGVIVPRNGRHGVLWLEQVGHGRVVHNDHVLDGAAKARQVLHKSIVEEGTVLSEQEVRAHLVWVQVLHQRFRILGETRCEDNKFINFVHSFEELGDIRPDKNVDGTDLSIYFDWQHNVGIFDRLKRRVNQGLIQVEYEGLAAGF